MISSTTRYLEVLQRMARNQTTFVNLRQMSTVSANSSSFPYDNKEMTGAKPFNTIPGPGGIYNIPYIGFNFHLKPFGNYTTGNIPLLFDDMIERYGPIFKIRTNIPTVVITDPKDFATMSRSEGKYPYRPNFELIDVYHKRSGSRPTVASLQGPEWWALRQPTQKMILRPKEIAKFFPMMNEVVDDFIQMLNNGHLKDHDVEETFMFFMAESAGTVFFNKRLGFLDKFQSEDSEKLQQALVDVFGLVLKTLIGKSNGFRFYRSKDYRTFESGMNFLREASEKYVKEAHDEIKKKKQLGTFDPDEPNMLQQFLDEFSEKELALIIEGLYFASVDSSAAGLQIILHSLAKYSDKQDKLREEIYNVIGGSDSNVPVTQDHLDKMPYLKACVKEMYRHSRIVQFGPVRILPVDVVLSGYEIPAGVQIYNYNAKACHDETIFENPQNYEPERWLRQNEAGRRQRAKPDSDSTWAVVPFGFGPRMCPGRRLFENELFLLLAKLIQKTRVGLEPESVDVGFEYRLFLKSVEPIQFTFTPVDSK